MILDVHPGSRIRIFPIPDPGSGFRGQKSTGSRIRNTGWHILYSMYCASRGRAPGYKGKNSDTISTKDLAAPIQKDSQEKKKSGPGSHQTEPPVVGPLEEAAAVVTAPNLKPPDSPKLGAAILKKNTGIIEDQD
jgi:hypothetical protein